MIYTTEELKIDVKKARLMSRAELMEHEDKLPEVSSCCWWLLDLDENDEDYVAYAEGNYTEDEMFCSKTDSNTYVRVVLDIDTSEANVGKEFAFSGYVFTVLSDSLAISNNFIGTAKYYDEELINYMYSDDEITCTLNAVISNMISIQFASNMEFDAEIDTFDNASGDDILNEADFYILRSYDNGEVIACFPKTFNEGKTQFRKEISEVMDAKTTHYTGMIREYCNR